MLTKSKIALSLALFVTTASGAVADSKRAVHHQTSTVRYVSGAAYQSFGLVMVQQGFQVGPTDPTNGVAR